MSTKTKHEREVSDTIYNAAGAIEQYLAAAGVWRSCKIESELYYDEDGSNPSRFLEVNLAPGTSLRVAVQRNERSRPRWTCYWVVFKKGLSVEEDQFDDSSAPKLVEGLKKVLDQHSHLFA
jgi:hypothetical protein